MLSQMILSNILRRNCVDDVRRIRLLSRVTFCGIVPASKSQCILSILLRTISYPNILTSPKDSVVPRILGSYDNLQLLRLVLILVVGVVRIHRS